MVYLRNKQISFCRFRDSTQVVNLDSFVGYDGYSISSKGFLPTVVDIMVNKRVLNDVLGCSLKNDRMISVRFQGKPFNITVIQVYALTNNAEEAEVEWFYEDLQDLTPLKDYTTPLSL